MSEERIEIIVPVAGRSYPLTVSQEEVDEVMAAAKAIDDSIAKLRSQFAVQDRNDLLAMTALQLSIKLRAGGAASADAASTDSAAAAEAAEAAAAEAASIDKKLESSIESLLQRLDSAMEG